MKVSMTIKNIAVLTLALLISSSTSVVLLKGSSIPNKQVKKRVRYPSLNITNNESNKLRINGWRMNPTDADRISKEGRNLKVQCKFL